MNQSIGLVALVVREYDEAIDFYVGTVQEPIKDLI